MEIRPVLDIVIINPDSPTLYHVRAERAKWHDLTVSLSVDHPQKIQLVMHVCSFDKVCAAAIFVALSTSGCTTVQRVREQA